MNHLGFAACGVVLALAGCGITEPLPLKIVSEDRDPAWSPDGQWLAFEHTDSAATGLYIARVDGSERRLLVPGPMGQADWSPDGTALVFTAGLAYQIYRIDLAMDSIRQLTSEGFNVGPAWSPDGRSIALTSNGNDGSRPPDLWLINADGTQHRRVPLPSPRNEMGDADWSPDGRRLVASVAGAFARLFVTDTSGADTLWITPATANALQPAWSPTGEWIGYVKGLHGKVGDIWLIRPDGTGDHLLVRSAFHPTWSPDAQRVAFSRRGADEVAIWAADTLGNNLQRLSWPLGTAMLARPSPGNPPRP